MPRRHANVHDDARDQPDNTAQRDAAGPNAAAPSGFTKEELLEAGDLSSKTFDMIRKAARVKGPAHGGLSFFFPIEDVAALVRTAEGGRFTERGGPAAQGWRKHLPGVDAYLKKYPIGKKK